MIIHQALALPVAIPAVARLPAPRQVPIEVPQPPAPVNGDGRIVAIHGSVIDVFFAGPMPALHEVLSVGYGRGVLLLEVQRLLGRGMVRAIAMGHTDGLARGLSVVRTGRPVQVPVGPATLGRLFNALGEPLDGLAAPAAAERWPIHRPAPSFDVIRERSRFLETGIKVIDLLAPVGHPGTAGVIGGGGVGKTVILQELTRALSGMEQHVVVFAGVGERTREGNDLWLHLRETGALANSIVVLGQMSEAPGPRYRAPLTALTMAEYFRDVEDRPVLFLVDSISRYLQAGGEVSSLLGQLPGEMGYQPTLDRDLSIVEARVAAPAWVGMTSVQAFYVPADDLSDPVVAQAFVHLDAIILLSRSRAAHGLYPAVDPITSGSRLLTPACVGERHYQIAMRVKETIQRSRALSDIVTMLGMHEVHADDQRILARARRLERFLTQPLFAVESLTGRAGRRVPLEDTLAGCEAILNGQYDDIDEHHLYMIGSTAEACLAEA